MYILTRSELEIIQKQKAVENIPSNICEVFFDLYIIFKKEIDEIRYTNRNDITEKSIIWITCFAMLGCLVKNRIIEIPIELVTILKYGDWA